MGTVNEDSQRTSKVFSLYPFLLSPLWREWPMEMTAASLPPQRTTGRLTDTDCVLRFTTHI